MSAITALKKWLSGGLGLFRLGVTPSAMGCAIDAKAQELGVRLLGVSLGVSASHVIARCRIADTSRDRRVVTVSRPLPGSGRTLRVPGHS